MASGPTPPAEGFHLLRSPVGLARAAVALLGAVIVSDVLALVAGLNLRGEYAGLGDTAVYDAGSADRAEVLYGAAGTLQGFALLATAIVFVIWFRRVRLNAEVFDAALQPMRPGWAIGAWFVPVANLWLPRRIAAGIWTASAQTHPDGSRRTVSNAPLNLWWTLWIVSTLFTWVASKNYEQAELSPGLADSVALIMAADALDIAAAALAIVFVRKLTRMQGERAALVMKPFPAPGPAGPASV
ncbi:MULTISPECIES: DUF4328 domain-containing protein [unclassified Streptomyces]|uniref:DUF4328 domain-containing protein n=1 Tax=unclassified Streptomyces TaxID=2593676 RepID=UPI001F2FE165|nr:MULTISPECIES: DUF4328 domain-containing protein [unclassified Streptomyces]